MFPDPCGDQFELAVLAGVAPTDVVPDDYFVVRGGAAPLPPTGQLICGAVGPTLSAAAAAVPHGQIRATTVGTVRVAGGVVEWQPAPSRSGTMNKQHVNITEVAGTVSVFPTAPIPNPVPTAARVR